MSEPVQDGPKAIVIGILGAVSFFTYHLILLVQKLFRVLSSSIIPCCKS